MTGFSVPLPSGRCGVEVAQSVSEYKSWLYLNSSGACRYIARLLMSAMYTGPPTTFATDTPDWACSR